ncbi:SagB/ThcOx family dehydrogenase [Streptomyces luteolifulvus]|uniref:SagB/ThcOx family dehydrogenase n=1 Tax=Streptomyces luteolifulvus TaxID=2615112 RepID=A0A6H9V1S1_9ACTN|nr:SagB family peptide dehydrogenase [Streptomyces luteolifulvus]KAB1145282.1 SagB/ThcOx family dehydrogenase [Streptomyces luteolifulvus]
MSTLLVISPLARVRWVAGRLEISAAGHVVTLSISEADALAVMHAFAQPSTVSEVRTQFSFIDVDSLIAELQSAAVLVPPAQVAAIESARWDVDSLTFHRRSRASAGGGSPPVSPPVVPARPASTMFRLDWPTHPMLQNLPSLLNARESRRSWPDEPTRDLGRLLWLSARNRDTGPHVVSRPYPSGGAAYSLELYPVVAPDAVASVPAGIYRYLPDTHALELISPDAHKPVLAGAAAAAGAERAPVAIVVTSRFERASSTYGELAYSLVLKEVGALFQTFYLVAEYLGLAVCALGGGCPDDLFAEAIGAHDLIEPVVGELVVGPASR